MLRQIFCRHNFQLVQSIDKYKCETDNMPSKIVKVFLCPKCGKTIRIEED